MADENSSTDSEYEEEEEVVFVQLNGLTDPDLLNQIAQSKLKFLNINSDQPLLQINDKFFSGSYTETVGTGIFFKEDKDGYKPTDKFFDKIPKTKLEFVTSTTKVLDMNRIFVKEKDRNKGDKTKNKSDKSDKVEDKSDKVKNKSDKSVEKKSDYQETEKTYDKQNM